MLHCAPVFFILLCPAKRYIDQLGKSMEAPRDGILVATRWHAIQLGLSRHRKVVELVYLIINVRYEHQRAKRSSPCLFPFRSRLLLTLERREVFPSRRRRMLSDCKPDYFEAEASYCHSHPDRFYLKAAIHSTWVSLGVHPW